MKPPSLIGLSAAVLLGLAAGVPTSASASTPTRSAGSAIAVRSAGYPTTCRGLPAQVVQPYEDFVGTDADDVLVVLSPGAEVWGNYGNDLICLYGDANHGAIVHGGPEDDTIVSYSGSHFVAGDAGNDVVVANGGFMEVEGGDDADILNVGGASSAIVRGGAGNDTVFGSPGDDELFGNGGNDVVYGWAGDDTLYGDDGNDSLHGGLGWDGHAGSIGWDSCQDSLSPVDGGMFGDCESVVQIPAGPPALAVG